MMFRRFALIRIYSAILSMCVCLIAADARSSEANVRNIIDYGAVGRITLRIVDDRGAPVEEASIEFNYFSNSQEKRISARCGRAGLCVFEDSVQVDMEYSVTKSGYYKTKNSYKFLAEARRQKEIATDGKWNPWNPEVRVVLKKTRNPTSMYAKEIFRDYWIPVDQKVGFDFQVGDWVAPYGRGQVSDFVLLIRRRDGEKQGIESKEISFTSSGDGVRVMQKDSWSNFGSAYEAPDDSYLQHLEDTGQFRPKSGEAKKESYYFIFRTRTKIDDKGRAVGGTYSKMLVPIQVNSIRDNKVMIAFRYWHNPDGTRNLEFDPKRNLFKVFGHLERVDDP